MQTASATPELAPSQQAYQYAATLLITQKKSSLEVTDALVQKGFNYDEASILVNNLETEYQRLKKSKAQKDVLYGALWCIGGIVATMANIGFIFWGAIVFGGIQFFRGLANLNG